MSTHERCNRITLDAVRLAARPRCSFCAELVTGTVVVLAPTTTNLRLSICRVCIDRAFRLLSPQTL